MDVNLSSCLGESALQYPVSSFLVTTKCSETTAKDMKMAAAMSNYKTNYNLQVVLGEVSARPALINVL